MDWLDASLTETPMTDLERTLADFLRGALELLEAKQQIVDSLVSHPSVDPLLRVEVIANGEATRVLIARVQEVLP